MTHTQGKLLELADAYADADSEETLSCINDGQDGFVAALRKRQQARAALIAEIERMEAERDALKQTNEMLLEALKVARDHIHMGMLEVSHCKDAELIRAAIDRAEKGQTT